MTTVSLGVGSTCGVWSSAPARRGRSSVEESGTQVRISCFSLHKGFTHLPIEIIHINGHIQQYTVGKYSIWTWPTAGFFLHGMFVSPASGSSSPPRNTGGVSPWSGLHSSSRRMGRWSESLTLTQKQYLRTHPKQWKVFSPQWGGEFTCISTHFHPEERRRHVASCSVKQKEFLVVFFFHDGEGLFYSSHRKSHVACTPKLLWNPTVTVCTLRYPCLIYISPHSLKSDMKCSFRTNLIWINTVCYVSVTCVKIFLHNFWAECCAGGEWHMAF